MNILKELRKKNKLSQSKLQELLKTKYNIEVTVRTIQNWESGRTPIKAEAARDLANEFGVSVDYLLGVGEDDDASMKFMLEHEKYMDTLQGLIGLGLLVQLKGVKVADKVIENLKNFYGYPDDTENDDPLGMHSMERMETEKYIQFLLYGVARLKDSTRIPLMDYFSLSDEKKKIVDKVITIFADNPTYMNSVLEEVYTDEELHDLYGITPEDIELYGDPTPDK